MIYESEALQNIFNEYEEDRTKARIMRDRRVKEITEKYPHLLEIQKKITELGIENFKNILDNPQKSESYNEKFKKELSKLEKEKEEFLLKNGIEKDFDEVKYKCEKCLDTGYIDNEKCPCLVQKIIDLHYEMSNMKNILHDFSEFSFDYYGDKKIEKLGMTEKENIKDIYRKAINFCENDASKNLLFYGGCGLGKTFLSSCIAKKMLDSGKSVIYQTATSLFSDYEDYKFGRKDGGYEELYDILTSADLLIIDDLGTEVSNPISMQFFFDIINKRTMLSKKIIISTNLTMDGILKKYTDRLFSRLYESFEILHFVGEDIRIQKLTGEGE
ncbi:MAG: ATP-binding protein [Clostridia bacterium]|nr:ATP-binding protein [Clostridia bacterium]